jgi:hypothetical protein
MQILDIMCAVAAWRAMLLGGRRSNGQSRNHKAQKAGLSKAGGARLSVVRCGAYGSNNSHVRIEYHQEASERCTSVGIS